MDNNDYIRTLTQAAYNEGYDVAKASLEYGFIASEDNAHSFARAISNLESVRAAYIAGYNDAINPQSRFEGRDFTFAEYQLAYRYIRMLHKFAGWGEDRRIYLERREAIKQFIEKYGKPSFMAQLYAENAVIARDHKIALETISQAGLTFGNFSEHFTSKSAVERYWNSCKAVARREIRRIYRG